MVSLGWECHESPYPLTLHTTLHGSHVCKSTRFNLGICLICKLFHCTTGGTEYGSFRSAIDWAWHFLFGTLPWFIFYLLPLLLVNVICKPFNQCMCLRMKWDELNIFVTTICEIWCTEHTVRGCADMNWKRSYHVDIFKCQDIHLWWHKCSG